MFVDFCDEKKSLETVIGGKVGEDERIGRNGSLNLKGKFDTT